jgi:O-antigen/teichoic acid export membrane protein
MKDQFANAVYGVLDYAAYPIGMLLVAPVVLHHLGPAEYGLWAIATAAVSTGGIVASGFGDANIQLVARLRGQGEIRTLESIVRSMVGINLVLGLTLACAGLALSPVVARHIAAFDIPLQRACVLSLRIASVLMLVRALESVSISTLRAFERYGAAVRISIAVRLLTLALAAVLASNGQGTVSIMTVTLLLMSLGTCAQFFRLHQFLASASLWPAFNREATRALFGFGFYSWLQAVAGVLFSQMDRLILGVSLGAVAVASYALCVQLAQPLFGLTAAGLHFLFPYLSGRVDTLPRTALKRTLRKAFICNLVLVAIGTILLLAFGQPLLQAWAGTAIAQTAAPFFPLVIVGSALLGLSVTPTYALLALGNARSVAWLSIAGGGAMLLMMVWLLPRSGVQGLASARLFYGFFSLLLYFPLLRSLASRRFSTPAASFAPSTLEEASRL